MREHLDYLQKIFADREAFYLRELEGKERLIARLQGNLERYHATLPFRVYFALKRLLHKQRSEDSSS